MLTDGSLSFTPPANPKKKFLRSFNFPAKTEKKQKRSFFNILKKKKFDDVFFESQMLNLGENVSFDDYSQGTCQCQILRSASYWSELPILNIQAYCLCLLKRFYWSLGLYHEKVERSKFFLFRIFLIFYSPPL